MSPFYRYVTKSQLDSELDTVKTDLEEQIAEVEGGGVGGGYIATPKGSLTIGDVGKMVMWDDEPKVYAQKEGVEGSKMWWEFEITGDPELGSPTTPSSGWFSLSINPDPGDQIVINTPNFGDMVYEFDVDIPLGPAADDTMQNFVTWADENFDLGEVVFIWNESENRVDCEAGSSYSGSEGDGILIRPDNEDMPHPWFVPNANPWAVLAGGIDGAPADYIELANPGETIQIGYGQGEWDTAPGDNNQIAENLRIAIENNFTELFIEKGAGEEPVAVVITRTDNVVRVEAAEKGLNTGSNYAQVNQFGPPVINFTEEQGSIDSPAGARSRFLGKLLSIDGVNAIIDGQKVFTAIASEDMVGGTTFASPVNGAEVRNQVPSADDIVFTVLNGTPQSGGLVILGLRQQG